MAQDVDQISFEITGDSAVSTAIGFLEGLDSKSEYKLVHISLKTESSERKSPEGDQQLTLDKAQQKGNTQSNKVNPGTSHAKVLSALSRIDEDGAIPTKSILNELDLPEGTVYGAMSDLHDRGLVERTDERTVENSYGYTVSEAGEQELSRLRGLE